MMAESKVPDGIVRSISLVTAGDSDAVAVYLDGVRKLIGSVQEGDEPSAIDLANLIDEEGANGKVIHIQRYTCEEFFNTTCCGEVDIFEEVCPELLQHLSADTE